MGGYWSTLTYDTNVYLTTLADERGTYTFQIEPADGNYNGSTRIRRPAAAMWQNYRITVTDPLGHRAEYSLQWLFRLLLVCQPARLCALDQSQ